MFSVDDIKTSETVLLPGWCGEAWKCELRRPSVLALAATGAIPNPLMKTARKLFYNGISPDNGDLAEEGRVLLEIAKAAMVRPAYDELEDAGIPCDLMRKEPFRLSGVRYDGLEDVRL